MMLARFDGLELDSGTVVEFTVAKLLGKPVVVLRSDFRRLSCTGLSEPYNLMDMNWPRTVEIHIDSYMLWVDLFSRARQGDEDRDSLQGIMELELGTVKTSMDEIARQVIAGFKEVLQMSSHYPEEYRELVYKVIRFGPGSGFDQLLTAEVVTEIVERFSRNGTL
jgi:nucleoside 2-deoxyribosyltransferase